MSDPLQTILDANDVDEDPGDVAGDLVDSTNDAIDRLAEVGTEPDPPDGTLIEDWHDLDSVRSDPSDDYVLVNDLTPETDGYDEVVDPEGDGFDPIDSFTGTLDGLNNEIGGLVIDRPDDSGVGLFGSTSDATIENIGLVDVDITASDEVGGIAGEASDKTTIENSFVTGSINATADGDAGGLVGTLSRFDDETGQITQSYAIADVADDNDGGDVGGLVGRNSGEISESFASGDVTGDARLGGLVGNNSEGEITKSYATADVTTVTDFANVGGLSGQESGEITESFATGTVTNGEFDSLGGISGTTTAPTEGTVQDSYWDRGMTTQPDAVGSGDPGDGVEGFGEVDDTNPADEMTGDDAHGNMVALDFDDTWRTVTEGDSLPPVPTDDGYPILRAIEAEPQLEAQGILDE